MSAIPILKEIHSFVAYFFLVSTLVFVVFCIVNFIKKTSFTKNQVLISKLSFISSHIQLLLGFSLWWLHGYAELLSYDAKAVMKDGAVRKMVIEHPLTNFIAIIILTIGYISIKKASLDSTKHIKGIIYYGIAIVFILLMIPYAAWWQN
jgi:hypothetical protein